MTIEVDNSFYAKTVIAMAWAHIEENLSIDEVLNEEQQEELLKFMKELGELCKERRGTKEDSEADFNSYIQYLVGVTKDVFK